MKNIILLIFSCFTIISCKNNKYEKRIIGSWYSLRENEKLKFDSDSLFVNGMIKIGTWKADKNIIEYKWLDYMSDSIKMSSYEYKLKTNDTLAFETRYSLNEKYTFLKSTNFTDFLFKKNNIDIILEKKAESKVQTVNDYGIKVFVKIKNNSIATKTEYSENIENLDYDIEMILSEINPYFTEQYNNFHEVYKRRVSLDKYKKDKIHYLLFADENVPKDSIIKIAEKLKKSYLTKVYQVFETKEIRYSNFSNLNTIKL